MAALLCRSVKIIMPLCTLIDPSYLFFLFSYGSPDSDCSKRRHHAAVNREDLSRDILTVVAA